MDYVTIKVHEYTRMLLRMIAAQTGEQMVQVLERLCMAEIERISDEAARSGQSIVFIAHTRKGEMYAIDRLLPKQQQGDATGEPDQPPDNNARHGVPPFGDDAV